MDYKKIGAFLKKEREQKGLSYPQVFEITRIQPSILKSIEEGEPQISEVFFKNFIKTYVKFLGLNLHEALKEGEIKKVLKKEEQVELKKKKYFKLRFSFPIFAALSLLILLILVYSFSNKSSSFEILNESDLTGFHPLSPKKWVKKLNTKANDSELIEGQKNQLNGDITRNQGKDANKDFNTASQELDRETDSNYKQEQGNSNQELFKQEASVLIQDEGNLLTGVKPQAQAEQPESLWKKIRSADFQHELMIKSLEPVKIYFKIDKQSTFTKDLSPSVWFVIKAKESLYIRFDEKVDQVEMFYNGIKWKFTSTRFFEKTFKI